MSAAIKAINLAGSALTAREIYDVILENNLYTFIAKDPYAILKSTLRKHTEGTDFKGKRSKVSFKIDGKGRYYVL
jgi:hypothetical protein